MKVAIGVGVALGTALLLALLIVPWFVESSTNRVTLRLVNDTPQTITVRGCSNPPDCDSTWFHRELEAGQEADTDVDSDDLVDAVRAQALGS